MSFEPANQGNTYGNPGYGPPPPPPPAQSGGNRTLWFVLLGGCLFILLCSCLIGVVVFVAGGAAVGGAVTATQPAVDQSDRFLSALRDGNWQAAFDLCSREFQQELGQPQRLQQFVSQGNRRPQSWNVTNRQVNNDEAQIDGTMTFQGGAQGTFRTVLDREGNTWRISGITLNPGGR